VAALDVADDVRTVHCDVVAVVIAEDEGRMDSPALDRRHVESEVLPFCVRCFEVFDHEIEGRVGVTWRCTRQEHKVCPTAQFQHNNLVVPLDPPCRRYARSPLIDQGRSLSGGRGRSRRADVLPSRGSRARTTIRPSSRSRSAELPICSSDIAERSGATPSPHQYWATSHQNGQSVWTAESRSQGDSVIRESTEFPAASTVGTKVPRIRDLLL
jgi:hypothetical protein